MKKSYHILTAIALSFAMLFCFAACAAEEPPVETTDPNLEVREYTLAADDASDLAVLDQYPNLKSVDLTGSTCYDAILDYIEQHPQVSVVYDVQLGSLHVTGDVSELILVDGEYDYDQLLKNLSYLPNVTAIQLPSTVLTAEQLAAISEVYPDISVGYTVMLMDQELTQDTAQLDLSALEPAQVDEILDELAKLTALTDIQLMDADGASKLSPVDVKKVMDAAPNATVHYTFELFGQMISTTDEIVEYVRVHIGNEGIPQIRAALDILPNCTYFKMDRCEVDNEVMAQLREDYPNTEIVWRVFFAFYNCLTDVEMLHCTNELTDQNVEVLKYCNDVLYLDIGHNFDLTNIDFVNYMPKLKIAIIVDSATPNIEPFANCPDLEWLEIVNCRYVEDLSPLENCTKLKGLNMSAVFRVTDLSPLYGLQDMERLYLGQHNITKEDVEAVKQALPNCWVTDRIRGTKEVSYNYGIGWRIDEDGDRADWYKMIREIFRYSEGYYNKDD